MSPAGGRLEGRPRSCADYCCRFVPEFGRIASDERLQGAIDGWLTGWPADHVRARAARRWRFGIVSYRRLSSIAGAPVRAGLGVRDLHRRDQRRGDRRQRPGAAAGAAPGALGWDLLAGTPARWRHGGGATVDQHAKPRPGSHVRPAGFLHAPADQSLSRVARAGCDQLLRHRAALPDLENVRRLRAAEQTEFDTPVSGCHGCRDRRLGLLR